MNNSTIESDDEEILVYEIMVSDRTHQKCSKEEDVPRQKQNRNEGV